MRHCFFPRTVLFRDDWFSSLGLKRQKKEKPNFAFISTTIKKNYVFLFLLCHSSETARLISMFLFVCLVGTWNVRAGNRLIKCYGLPDDDEVGTCQLVIVILCYS